MKFSAIFFTIIVLVTLLSSESDAGKIPVKAIQKAGKAIFSLKPGMKRAIRLERSMWPALSMTSQKLFNPRKKRENTRNVYENHIFNAVIEIDVAAADGVPTDPLSLKNDYIIVFKKEKDKKDFR